VLDHLTDEQKPDRREEAERGVRDGRYAAAKEALNGCIAN
jgi:hypothetical protein